MPCFEARVFLFMSGFLFRNMGWRNISRADSPACPSKTPHYFVDETLYSLKSVGGIGDGMWARSFLGFSPSLSLFSLHPAVGEPNTSLEPTLGFSYPSPLTWSIILSLFFMFLAGFSRGFFLQKGQHFEVEKYCLIDEQIFWAFALGGAFQPLTVGNVTKKYARIFCTCSTIVNIIPEKNSVNVQDNILNLSLCLRVMNLILL